MIIHVTVKPGSKKEAVDVLEDGTYRVAVRAPARDGLANEAVVEALAAHFKIAKSRVQLLRGATGRIKRFVIDTE